MAKPAVSPAPAGTSTAAPPPPPPAAAAPKPAPTPTPASSAKPAAAPAPGAGTPLLVSVAGFVVLAAGILFLSQKTPEAQDPARVAALEAQLAATQQRLAQLEGRAPTDLGPVAGRIAAIETSVKALAERPGFDPAALDRRIATLEQRPAPDVAGQLAAAGRALNAEFATRLETLDKKFAGDLSQAITAATAAANARANVANRLRVASQSLESGLPLGDIAGAPPALARFAKTAPPTEPALRLAFPAAAAKAEAASQPSAEGRDFADRMWAKAQTLVTVRKGDQVLVGAPAAVTTAGARVKLDAGDLAGAVAALTPLDSAATAAMAPWINDARALLAARAALAELAKS
jgi:hypothetical protein